MIIADHPRLSRPFVLAALALGCAVASLTVRAEPPAKAPVAVMSVVVKYDDLDLTTDKGVTALYKRVRNTARRVCAITTSNHVVDRQAAEGDCYRDAMATAVHQLGSGRLAALHEHSAKAGGN
jgi:UrcA family protein